MNTTNAGKSTFSKLSSTFKDTSSKLKSKWGENGFVILLLIIFVLIFVIVIIYVSFKIRSSNLQGKRLTSQPVKLDDLAKPVQVVNADIPSTVVGLEFSYCFWVYVANLEQTSTSTTSTNHKLIWFRGASSDKLTSANPLVIVDGVNSKMHIVLKTTRSTLSSTVKGALPYESDLTQVTGKNCFMNTTSPTCLPDNNSHVIMTIDYIPIQRWVHVAFSVDNKLITVYLDGDIYSVKSVDEFKSQKKLDSNLVLDKTLGDIWVGKNPAIARGNTLNGYLSRLEFYNYAMSISDVKDSYNAGPYKKSWLAYVGLDDYGVRAPIYKLSNDTPTTPTAPA